MLIFDELKKNDPHLRVLAWGALAGMGILMAGLWYVQIISHRHFVENQQAQSFRTVRIPAIRGKILDHQGRALAENRPNYNVSLYLEELREQFKAEYKAELRRNQPPLVRQQHNLQLFGWKIFSWKSLGPAYKLNIKQLRQLGEQARYRVVSNILQNLSANLKEPVGISYANFVNHYTNQLALPLAILTISNQAQMARFHEQQNTPPGVDLEMQPLRSYPYRATAAHIVGCLKFNNSSAEGEESFFNYRLPDYQGLVGIEGAFDQELRGRAGEKSVLVNNLGYRQSENILLPAEPGRNVVLTINLELQRAAEEALQNAPLVKTLPLRGAVVIMDPNSGDILALVSIPSYDPNLFIPRINPADWERLLDENLKPQRNRATQENYHPGSIFKIVVSLAALEAGLDQNEKIYNSPDPANPAKGHIMVGKRKIRDTAAPGDYDFRRGFIKSCNTYFVSNGLRCGVENIVKLGARLHLGERTQLPTLQDSPGSFPKLKRIRAGWSPGDTGNLCIGQGEVVVTPLQMAVMVSAVANGGKVFYPRLVERIEPQDLTSGEQPERFPKGRLRDSLGVSNSSLQIVREAMLADVEDKEGTGKGAAVEGFRACGKTGTAQVKDEENVTVDVTTWFASYAPYEDPRYVVIVMVESGRSGGDTCAPVAGKIYQKIKQMEDRGKPVENRQIAAGRRQNPQAGTPALR